MTTQNKIFNPLLNKTFLIRPNEAAFNGQSIVRPGDYQHPNQILRYADGQWLPDDGKPDLAFVNGVFYYGVNIPQYTNLPKNLRKPPNLFVGMNHSLKNRHLTM